jgi:hypothetical protein
MRRARIVRQGAYERKRPGDSSDKRIKYQVERLDSEAGRDKVGECRDGERDGGQRQTVHERRPRGEDADREQGQEHTRRNQQHEPGDGSQSVGTDPQCREREQAGNPGEDPVPGKNRRRRPCRRVCLSIEGVERLPNVVAG